MSEFKREGRYIVVKPDYEDSLRTERLRNYIDEMCFHTPDCVVVEADWPEYEPVWRMIERRVMGDSSNEQSVEVLGYSVVGNKYAIRLTKGEVLELSENYADHLIELIDRKHLTDAQVELAALREELAKAAHMRTFWAESAAELDKRLAAAEQRNAELVELTKDALKAFNYHPEGSCYNPGIAFVKPWSIRAAELIKPTESGAS